MDSLYPRFYMSPTPQKDCFSSSSSSQSSEWSREENKAFESALAIYGDEHDPDRWLKVAALIPGKTVSDVIKQYRELEEDVGEIEAGRVPVPGYITHSGSTSAFTLNLFDVDGGRDSRKRPLGSTKTFDQGRKKGVPWTEDEHRRFLKGLMKYGKGDWRNISRNFVVTKTPTQVASHAQKYFIRQKQLTGVKDKRRPSIHDITTLNLATSHNTFSHTKRSSLSSTPIDWHYNHQQQQYPTTSSFNFMGLSSYDHHDNVSNTGFKLHQGHNLYNMAASPVVRLHF